MQYGIVKSVGKNGANESVDVKFVQTCLNANKDRFKSPYSPLGVDGLCREKTINAIKQFQKECIGKPNPDGRVDPGATTIQFLTMYLTKVKNNSGNIAPAAVAAPVAVTAGFHNLVVSYASGIDSSLVSPYSIEVIKMALKRCDMSQAVISSTLRTPERQASVLYDNAKKNYAAQVELYGKRGRGKDVLEVYTKNKDKDPAVVKKLMAEKIEEYFEKGVPGGSMHCVSPEMYKKRNAIDLGVRGTASVCKNYNPVKFTNALLALQQEGYIAKFLDERGTNGCWHIEVIPFIKNIDSSSKGSMEQTRKFINGAPA